ncbi:MAG: hypothetical protein AAB538_02215 [Patescibacteria group bacterium]
MRGLYHIPRDRDARYLTLVVLLVVILAVGQVWLWGSVFDAASVFRDRQTQQEQLANVRQLTEDIRSQDTTQQALVEQATVAFPVNESVPLVVERVEALAEAQGLSLTLESIAEQRVNPRPAAAQLVPFDLNLTLQGPPHALLAFLDAVEHMQELTRIESWALSTVAAKPPTAKVYDLQMKLRFFLQPPLLNG